MGLHQIIYTSCMRGINGVNDGQQVYSYDAEFRDVNNDEIKSLFAYQTPALRPGEVMTEEIALTLPRAFVYRKLDNGGCALANVTYLGRDYMGSAGRFGNHLSHVIVSDEGELPCYPCEYFGTQSLRDHMEFEEVNNPNRPDFLPTPTLERGYNVDVDAVIDFLGEGDRMEIYKNMLHAALAFETQRKRVVICDERENIVMWIAAIEYALPLKSALGISFSTYDFDPSLSASRICGVIPEGSRYTPESRRMHLTFDLIAGDCAEFDKDERFFEFIDTAMSFSYGSLEDFHRFLAEGYSYCGADEGIYDAYRLYTMTIDGFVGMSVEELNGALSFAASYASDAEKSRILASVLQQGDSLMTADSEVFGAVMRYLLSNISGLSSDDVDSIKAMAVDRVLCDFLAGEDERAFISLYNEIDALCRAGGFSAASEIMRDYNQSKLLNVMQNDIPEWKTAFIIRIIAAYAKDCGARPEQLREDAPLGGMLIGIARTVYARGADRGGFAVRKILDEFSDDCACLVYMAVYLEGVTRAQPDARGQTDAMWRHFGSLMARCQPTNFAAAYNIFLSLNRADRIYTLYYGAMSSASTVEEKKHIFDEHYVNFIRRNPQYEAEYLPSVAQDYYNAIKGSSGPAASAAKVSLFKLLSNARLNVPFAAQLADEIAAELPFGRLTSEEESFIAAAFGYVRGILRLPIDGRLALHVIAYTFEKTSPGSNLEMMFANIEALSDRPADVSYVAQQYFEWVTPFICRLCFAPQDIDRAFRLFDMQSDAAYYFLTDCSKNYIKACRDEKEYTVYCNFLWVVFKYGNKYVREEIGRQLLKTLGKQRMTELDLTVKRIYYSDPQGLELWREISEAADSSGGSMFGGFSGFFKKKDQ